MSQDLLQVAVAKIKLLSFAMAWNKHEFGNIFVPSKYNCVKSWYSHDDCLEIVNVKTVRHTFYTNWNIAVSWCNTWMLTEQRPQPNIHNPECAADSLHYPYYKQLAWMGVSLGLAKYGELSINSINDVTVPIKIK